MHQIENKYLKIKARDYGAELTSIYSKSSNIEHLWQADESFWGWHAPLLFPVVGRCLNDEIIVDGRKFEMEKHGFARKSDFKLQDFTDNKMVFSLKSDEKTLKNYPYVFELLVAYRLQDNILHVSYEVVNRDNKNIYFSIGGHPAFAVPFMKGEGYHDYYLQFEQVEDVARHYIDENGFFDGRKDACLVGTDTLSLKPTMFKDDALIFKELKSKKISIRSPKHKHYLSVDFKGFDYLGLWAKVNAHYVCIEPWLGCADTAGEPVDIKNKEGIITLEPRGEFSVGYTIEIG